MKRTMSAIADYHETRTDKNGMSDAQTYDYAADPNGVVEIFRKTKRGYRNAAGNALGIGYRRAYHDYSF